MKTRTLFLALLIISFTANSQDWIEFAASESTKPNYELLKSTDTIVEFEINVPGMFSTAIDTFNRVLIKEHSRMDSVGYPEIPIISYLVAIPSCDSVILNIEVSDSIKYTNMNIYPAAEIVEDSTGDGVKYLREEFEYNEVAYSNNSFFPGIFAETLEKGNVRTQHCISVRIFPVQFNPALHEINAYSKIKVTLTFENPTGQVNENVGIFNEMLGNTMINYFSNGLNASVSCGAGDGTCHEDFWITSLPNDKIDDPCDYLIITPAGFFGNTDINSLAMHREMFNGFDVKIVSTDVIYSEMPNDLPYKQIWNLIRNTYNDGIANNTFDGKLAYVNLFGDVELENNQDDGIPTYSTGFDIYFTQLTIPAGQNNPDPYPDLMIGRCSADSEEQVGNIVAKILNYNPQDYLYKNEMLSVVGFEHDNHSYLSQSSVLNDIIEIDGNEIYNKTCLVTSDYNAQGYEIPLEWTLSNPCTPWNLINEIMIENPGDGKMFVFYIGHGSDKNWYLEDNSSSNTFHYGYLGAIESGLSFILSAACLTGGFHNTDDCMAERFLCYDANNKGSIGFAGASKPTSIGIWKLPKYFFNSYMTNYSFVMGESIMEIKIAKWYNTTNHNWCKDLNLFGDPALNLKYENSEIINPDLTLKDFEITFQPDPVNWGDNVNIEAKIRNITRINTTTDFIVHCYIGEPGEPGTIEIGQYTINGIEGNHQEIAQFTWETENFEPDIYDIYIYIDPENNINEEDETNNINHSSRAIYHFYANFPVSNNMNSNAHVITFDLYDEYYGQEIIFGKSIFSTEGLQINPFSGISVGNSCIANLTNNENYQIIQIHKTPNPKVVSTGNPSWQYDISGTKYSPVVFDINNDGMEEVLCLILDNNSSSLLCLNFDGTLRWEMDEISDPPAQVYIDPMVGNFNGQQNSIILLNKDGTFLNIIETSTGIPEISNSYTIPNLIAVESVPVASDINKDGEIEIIIIYRVQIQHQDIRFLASYRASDFSENFSIILDNKSDINPIISDLNNNGESEIIVEENFGGLNIYNYELELINHIQENDIYISELVSGDIYNDGNLDIICQVKIGDFYGIKAYDIDGNQTFFTPVIGNYESCWLSDIVDEDKFYFTYGDLGDLYVVNIPNAGANIGWPGQRANMRNTGVYEQPAYFGENGETVFWMNTIILSPDVDNIIPEGSTVIIKPGTKIRAHANSSLLVHGTLIAEGTEKFPIIFTADIYNPQEGYWQGITVPNHSALSMKYCEIKDAEIGILFEDHNEISFSNCLIENNLEGIAVFNSSPVIKENLATDNNIGIGCYKNAAPVLTDLLYEMPFKKGIINNNTGILISQAIVYLDNGYNDIYNLFSGGYYINIISEPANNIKARYNYWGTTNVNEIYEYLNPSENFQIEPILTSPQSSYVSGGDDESEMLKSATTSLESGDYSTAENTFKTIIEQYPESQEAYMSVSGLFDCTNKSNGNWDYLKNYFYELYNDSNRSIEFNKLTFGYINLCKREQGKFDEAVTNYESIVLNNPTYNDSVFAVIDIGNTYEEAGNYKTNLGELSYLIPVSRGAHVEKTVDLLLSLKSSEITPSTESQSIKIVELFPNPADDIVTLKLENPTNDRVSIKLFDVTGRLIKNNYLGVLSIGIHETNLNISDVYPGVYYLSLLVNHTNRDARKLIIK
ncbi:MAG: T9SS type A sorting domain-containing protein [Bacteroidales bacterium]|nr:T9SS type A sorting domain-containing protein [Bacteroidales bacterium]MCF8405069.1 T9SS type A sorting domain-containing protein [Bacteroidales bacterium]